MVTLTSRIKASQFNHARYHQDDFYNSYLKKRDISPIPQLGDPNWLVNIQGFKAFGGDLFFHDIVEKFNYSKTVFEVQMEQPRIILADPISVLPMFDVSKVYKTQEAGIFQFNPISIRGYLPSFFDNGKTHRIKKIRQYRLLNDRTKKLGLYGIFKIIRQEMKKQPRIASSSGKPASINNAINEVTVNTFTRVFLGKALNDYELFKQWFGISVVLKPVLDPTFGSRNAEYKEIANKMFKFVKSTPIIKKAAKSTDTTTMEKEFIWFTMWLGAEGVRRAHISMVKRFHTMTNKQKAMIQDEAARFFSSLERHGSRSFSWLYKGLKVIDTFVLEMIRLESPVLTIHGRARKDFVVNSMNGRYQIKKDDYLQALVHSAMRNPKIFGEEGKDELDLKRNRNKIKKNMFAFGGPFYQRPRPENHKCIGQDTALNIMKLMVLNLARCHLNVDAVDASGDIIANNFTCC